MRAPRWRTIGTLFRLEPGGGRARPASGIPVHALGAGELGLPAIGVQHHHAHIAAVLAEHGVAGPAVGPGVRRHRLRRGWPHLGRRGAGGRPGRVPTGGSPAVRPARRRRSRHPLAVAQPRGICLARPGARARRWSRCWRAIDAAGTRASARRRSRAASTRRLASSMGRLFDAAACLLGLRLESQYEGSGGDGTGGARRAAAGVMLLPFPLLPSPEPWVLDPVPLLLALAERRQRGDDPADLAASFHETVARAAIRVARAAADATGLDLVVLLGWQLPECAAARPLPGARRRRRARRCCDPHLLSPNDGAISFGQAAVAAARLSQGAPAASPATAEVTMCLGIPGRVVEMRDDTGLPMGWWTSAACAGRCALHTSPTTSRSATTSSCTWASRSRRWTRRRLGAPMPS